ncbi:Gamma-glutamyltranspeptidase 1 [Smittium culicis]|uniref:Glutathione hydrolase n=1 Tax=Smittium culicis TaxID=133412 RepID=A0A1R1YQN0_9FUNG|nr:Gamma-glutamyltranspeptidase 1 [Smittium culicis]
MTIENQNFLSEKETCANCSGVNTENVLNYEAENGFNQKKKQKSSLKKKLLIASVLALGAYAAYNTISRVNYYDDRTGSVFTNPDISEMYVKYLSNRKRDLNIDIVDSTHVAKRSDSAKEHKRAKCNDLTFDEGYVTDSNEAFGRTGAVATDEGRCSQIGIDVLKEGGSAVDAAIAGGLCVGLLNAYTSGIGGGGFMLIRKPNGESETIDFREMAPSGSKPDMYVANNTLSTFGGLAIGVPGELRGYELAHKKYGKLSWSRLFQPTIKLAREGYVIGTPLANSMRNREKDLRTAPGFLEVYFSPNGTLLQAGQISKRVKLSETLEKVANLGADEFYKGETTKSMVKAIQDAGGIITLQDFANYKPEIKKTQVLEYNGRKVITAAPATSGPVVSTVLNILQGYKLKQASKRPLSTHRIVEAFKFGFSLRTDMGDPNFVDNSFIVNKSVDKEFGKTLRARITDDLTHSYQYYDLKNDIKNDRGTTHLAILDKDDMAVSFTSTVNLHFGSKVVDPNTGVIFNNEMDDFGTPGLINAFGLPPSPSNFIAPGKRPMSSTAATIVEKDGKVEFVLGAAGGSKIITSTTQVLLNVIEFNKSLKQSVDMPRIHNQLLPEKTEYEKGYPQFVLDSLEMKKHNLTVMSPGSSIVQGIRRLSDGRINAVSDGRRSGIPAAY